MGALKFLGNTAVFLFMGISISLIVLSLVSSNFLAKNEGLDTQITDISTKYVQEHQEPLREFLMQNSQGMDISKSQIKDMCAENESGAPGDICRKIDMLSEEQAKSEYITQLVNQQFKDNSFADSLISGFSQQATPQLKSMLGSPQGLGNPMNYLLAGIFGYLLSIAALFAIEGFRYKTAAYKTARDTFFNTIPFLIPFGLIYLITPNQVINLLTKIVGNTEVTQMPLTIVNMMITVMLEIIRSATNPVFIITLVATVTSLVLMVILRPLKNSKK